MTATTSLWPRHARNLAWAVAVGAFLAGCASAPRKTQPTFKASHSSLANAPARAPDQVAAANDVLFRAMALVGTPYRWGGNTPDSGFDCSGLVDYIYKTATGLRLPHSSRDMAKVNGHNVSHMTKLASGDLVFFASGGDISHVGVYVGKGRFVHAPNSGGTVRLDDIDGPYWREHFVYGKRLLN